MGHIYRNCPTNPYVPSSKQKQKATLKQKVKAADCSIDNTVSDNANDDDCDCDDVDDVIFTVSHNACNLSSALSNKWIIDSGATRHTTPCRRMFETYIPLHPYQAVALGNGTDCKAVGIGRVAVDMLCEGTIKRYVLWKKSYYDLYNGAIIYLQWPSVVITASAAST